MWLRSALSVLLGVFCIASSNVKTKCPCPSDRLVAITGASIYCLPEHALLSEKCGNAVLQEDGICPIVNSTACIPGHKPLDVNGLCLLEKGIYKCFTHTGPKKEKNNTKSVPLDPDSGSYTAYKPFHPIAFLWLAQTCSAFLNS